MSSSGSSTSRIVVMLVGEATRWSSGLIIEELALGSIKRRDLVLDSLANLRQFPIITHGELLALVDSRRLWGRELSAVAAGLLGSVRIADGAKLWTRDSKLKAAGAEIGVELVHEP